VADGTTPSPRRNVDSAMTRPRLALSRAPILGHRRRVGALDARIPPGAASLRRAAWAGLQDSMPRAALLSIHARVEGTGPAALEDPSLIQLWGPRFSAYVVAEADRAVFTLGRSPDDAGGRRRAVDLAEALDAFLAGRRMPYGEAGRGLGVSPNRLRYAAPTGRVLMRWDGARQPIVWTVPAPAVDAPEARLELARRFLHVFGPGTASTFGRWAGIRPARARAAFDALAGSLAPVRTPVGEAWILAEDEASFREPPDDPAPARLLPSGDAYYLLQDADRELLVPDAGRRRQLWTPRVWPGAVLVAGEIAGVWRRADADLTIVPWVPLPATARAAVEAEATSLPLAGLGGQIRVRWSA
jgi:hypothetical protein